MFGFFKRRRRERLRSAPFPPAWLEIIEKNVPFYARLPEADRRELQGHVQVFLAEKNFEGCGGLELTDEIKVTIAAQACRALAPSQTRHLSSPDHDPGLSRRPTSPERSSPSAAGSCLEGEQVRAGRGVEGRSRDRLLGRFSGDGPRSQLRPEPVLHEFAHLLDMEDGAADGTPILDGAASMRPGARSWGRSTSGSGSDQRSRAVTPCWIPTAPPIRRVLRRGDRSLLREARRAPRQRHPELYEELKSFYRQDPARLLATAGSSPP